jgi:hypothetical protein
MVCSPSSPVERAGGRTDRAGGQHCDESGGNRLLSGHAVSGRCCSQRPRRLAASSERRQQAGGQTGQTQRADRTSASRGRGLGRRIVQRAPGRWEPESGPDYDRATNSRVAAARVDRSNRGHQAGGISGQILAATTMGIIAVGTAWRSPFPPAGQAGGGQARRRLRVAGWDGASVVVRGRESRPHGQGRQQVRSLGAGRPGGRR